MPAFSQKRQQHFRVQCQYFFKKATQFQCGFVIAFVVVVLIAVVFVVVVFIVVVLVVLLFIVVIFTTNKGNTHVGAHPRPRPAISIFSWQHRSNICLFAGQKMLMREIEP